MPGIDINASVGELVAGRPQLSRVFEELQIDYCCGGSKSLQDACAERGLDTSQVIEKLDGVECSSGEPDRPDWRETPLSELCDHIEQTHHAYLRRELPGLHRLLVKVVEVHTANHPELSQVLHVFVSLRSELEPHMMKEEQVLFPAIRQMEARAQVLSFAFGSVANPIQMMQHEHDIAANALRTVRQLTKDFQPPADACNTYRAVLEGLRQLELDTHQHIHKENNILFPRAERLEGTLASATP